MFQVPLPSRFDLNFSVLGFPVRVSPLFWLLAVLLGIRLQDPLLILIWVIIVFFSILIHEMGHGVTMRRFGQDAYLVLHAFGGLAVPVSSRRGGSASRTPVEQLIISFAGPLAGFLLAGLVVLSAIAAGGSVSITRLLFIIPFPSVNIPGSPIFNIVAFLLLQVNIFWGLINLIPVFPLDGGRIAQSLFTMADPWDGPRKALWLSVIVGAVIAAGAGIILRDLWLAFLFGILALQSYQLLQGRGFGL